MAAAGLWVLPLAVIGISAGISSDIESHRVLRLEPNPAGTWNVVVRSAAKVLPDARPLQADLDGSGDGGRRVVLAGRAR